MSAPSERLDVRVRLVCFRPNVLTWTIDALLDATCTLGDAGTPVSLELERPSTEWFRSSMEELLDAWAHEDRVVQVLVAPDALDAQVRLESLGTRLQTHLVRVR